MPHAVIIYKNRRGKTVEFHPSNSRFVLGTELSVRNIDAWQKKIDTANTTGRPRWLRGATLKIVDDDAGNARPVR